MNVLIAGVGGQGTLLASRVLGKYAAESGLDCKLSEVHGMAQRGGSVITYVKMGDKIYSPIIGEGDADYLLAFEQLEALRWAHALKAKGTLIVNAQRIMPLPVIIGAAAYPADIDQKLASYDVSVKKIEALGCASACGSIKAVNTVMIAALTKEAGLDVERMRDALKACVPEKALAMNLAAYEAGLTL